MSEAFKQPIALLPPMYLFVSPVLLSVIPRTLDLITFLFAFLLHVLFIFYAWHVFPGIVCKPLALFVCEFLLKNYLPPWCWENLILWLQLGCWVFLNAFVFRSRFCKYLLGVFVQKHIQYYSALLPVICLLASCVIHTSFPCHFCMWALQGRDYAIPGIWEVLSSI